MGLFYLRDLYPNLSTPMVTLGIEQKFTSYDNPKGKADTVWIMQTIKVESSNLMNLQA